MADYGILFLVLIFVVLTVVIAIIMRAGRKVSDKIAKPVTEVIEEKEEYRKRLIEDLELVEPGITLVNDKYFSPSGRANILGRDKDGVDVLIEIKHHSLSGYDAGALLRDREDYKLHSGAKRVRCILVAPTIPARLKNELVKRGIEYQEIP